jgi:hypothetical protein
MVSTHNGTLLIVKLTTYHIYKSSVLTTCCPLIFVNNGNIGMVDRKYRKE